MPFIPIVRLFALAAFLCFVATVAAETTSNATTISVDRPAPEGTRLEPRRRHHSKKKKAKSHAQPHPAQRSTNVAFYNKQGPGIGSWFQTDSSKDSTNGMSWCQIHYHDWTEGFAPDINIMMSTHGWNYEKAAEAYCGLEAIVKTPDGRSKKLYIVDAFDHQWVRTPGSIDIIRGPFTELYGKDTWNKNDVIKGVSWQLTGNRHPQYKFKGSG